jgi:hypothetical protein
MEAAFSIMIIGLGVVAMMQVFISGSEVNGYGDSLSKAVFLADEMRSMTEDVAFEDLLTFDGDTFSGADANGNEVAGLDSFDQTISAEGVDPDTLLPNVLADPEAIRMTVVVSRNGAELTRVSWLRSL